MTRRLSYFGVLGAVFSCGLPGCSKALGIDELRFDDGSPGGNGNETGGAAGSSAGMGGTGGSLPIGCQPEAVGGTTPGTSVLPVDHDVHLWLDGLYGLNDEGEGVGSWIDQVDVASPGAVQESALLRPTVVVRDGRKGAEFRGEQWLSLPESFDLSILYPPGYSDFSVGLTFLIAAEFRFSSECWQLVELASAEGRDGIGLRGTSDGAIGIEVGDAFSATDADTFGSDELAIVAVVVDEAGSVTWFKNGALAGSASPDEAFVPNVVDRVQNFVGTGVDEACRPFDGVLHELLLYRTALSRDELDSMAECLRSKWSVP